MVLNGFVVWTSGEITKMEDFDVDLETEDTDSPNGLSKEDLLLRLTQANSQIKTLKQTIAGQNELISVIQKHSVRSNRMAEISRKIDVRNLDTIEEVATHDVAELFGADKAALFLVDRDNVLLAIKKGYPRQFKFPPLDLVNDSDVMLIHALRQNSQPLVFRSIETYEIECGLEFRPHPSDHFFDRGGMICPLHYDVPDSIEREMVGLLALAGDGLAQEDISEASLVSEILATTLSNYFLLDKMSMLAETDGLTELYNHRHFQQELSRSLATYTRYKTPFSLIIVDIDHFKEVNDTYLHQTGDIVLKELSRIIRQNLRDNVDIAARYGGEEFALLLPQTRLEGAIVVAERLRESVERFRFRVGGESLSITISGGVAQYMAGMNKSDFVDAADTALYQAKNSGRNNIKAATPHSSNS